MMAPSVCIFTQCLNMLADKISRSFILAMPIKLAKDRKNAFTIENSIPNQGIKDDDIHIHLRGEDRFNPRNPSVEVVSDFLEAFLEPAERICIYRKSDALRVTHLQSSIGLIRTTDGGGGGGAGQPRRRTNRGRAAT